MGMALLESQSLSGWDGDFHYSAIPRPAREGVHTCRNPFQGGMGISTRTLEPEGSWSRWQKSQSLSGWDGDFHGDYPALESLPEDRSQSLSGWDGDFHDGDDKGGGNGCRV